MATKIFYNDNRIIIDGHADTAEECQAITAMCDEMANSENFKTIVYEKGHAVFERVDGGDAMMFAMPKYLTLDQYTREVGSNYDMAKGTIQYRLDDLEGELDESYEGTLAYRIDKLEALFARVSALENQTSKTLPYTADQLAALLAKLENLE